MGMLSAIMAKGDPYSRFEYAFKSEETKRKYTKLLSQFFNFCGVEGITLKEKADNFTKFPKENSIE